MQLSWRRYVCAFVLAVAATHVQAQTGQQQVYISLQPVGVVNSVSYNWSLSTAAVWDPPGQSPLQLKTAQAYNQLQYGIQVLRSSPTSAYVVSGSFVLHNTADVQITWSFPIYVSISSAEIRDQPATCPPTINFLTKDENVTCTFGPVVIPYANANAPGTAMVTASVPGFGEVYSNSQTITYGGAPLSAVGVCARLRTSFSPTGALQPVTNIPYLAPIRLLGTSKAIDEATSAVGEEFCDSDTRFFTAILNSTFCGDFVVNNTASLTPTTTGSPAPPTLAYHNLSVVVSGCSNGAPPPAATALAPPPPASRTTIVVGITSFLQPGSFAWNVAGKSNPSSVLMRPGEQRLVQYTTTFWRTAAGTGAAGSQNLLQGTVTIRNGGLFSQELVGPVYVDLARQGGSPPYQTLEAKCPPNVVAAPQGTLVCSFSSNYPPDGPPASYQATARAVMAAGSGQQEQLQSEAATFDTLRGPTDQSSQCGALTDTFQVGPNYASILEMSGTKAPNAFDPRLAVCTDTITFSYSVTVGNFSDTDCGTIAQLASVQTAAQDVPVPTAPAASNTLIVPITVSCDATAEDLAPAPPSPTPKTATPATVARTGQQTFTPPKAAPAIGVTLRPAGITGSYSYVWTVQDNMSPKSATVKMGSKVSTQYTISYARIGPGAMYTMTGSVVISNPSGFMYNLSHVGVTAESDGTGAGSAVAGLASCPKTSRDSTIIPGGTPSAPGVLVCSYSLAVPGLAPRNVTATVTLANGQQVTSAPARVAYDGVGLPPASQASSGTGGACAYLSDAPWAGSTLITPTATQGLKAPERGVGTDMLGMRVCSNKTFNYTAVFQPTTCGTFTAMPLAVAIPINSTQPATFSASDGFTVNVNSCPTAMLEILDATAGTKGPVYAWSVRKTANVKSDKPIQIAQTGTINIQYTVVYTRSAAGLDDSATAAVLSGRVSLINPRDSPLLLQSVQVNALSMRNTSMDAGRFYSVEADCSSGNSVTGGVLLPSGSANSGGGMICSFAGLVVLRSMGAPVGGKGPPVVGVRALAVDSATGQVLSSDLKLVQLETPSRKREAASLGVGACAIPSDMFLGGKQRVLPTKVVKGGVPSGTVCSSTAFGYIVRFGPFTSGVCGVYNATNIAQAQPSSAAGAFTQQPITASQNVTFNITGCQRKGL